MCKNLLICFILLLPGVAGFAQPVTNENASKKAQKSFNEGVEQAMRGETEDALNNFLEAVEEEPNFIAANIYAGNAYQELGRDSMAVVFFLKAIEIQDDYDVGIYKKIAESEQNMMLYAEAEEHIKIFLQHPKVVGETKKKAERLLKSVQFGKEALKNPVAFNPINMGAGVNSAFSEYFPSVSADNEIMVFTRKIEKEKQSGDVPGMTDMNEDFYITVNENNVWSNALNVGAPINTKLNEGAQNISADSKWLFYTLCNSPDGFGSCDIYYALKIGDVWSFPVNCGRSINGGDWDSQPSISADGKYLYFCSTRPGGFGSYDIWIAEMGEDGKWKKPLNAGPEINTAYDEQCPFIHPDGRTLYFSSNGHPGMGKADLFYAKMTVDNTQQAPDKWQTPVNLGYPINTNKSEITLTVTADGNTAYYASDRSDSYGGLDLYHFILPPQFQPEPVTYVKATVRDEKTKVVLKSNIQLVDLETGGIVTNSTSDPKSGEFLVCLPIGKKYALYVNKEGYLFHSENFSLENAIPDTPYKIDIYLQPVQLGEKVILNNIFFETASAELLPESETELLKVKELLTNNAALKIKLNGHTDNVGSEADNMTLSENRAHSVKTFLEKQGISSDRIQYAGYGETQPVSSNETEEGRALNRRTEMEIVGV